MSASADDWDDWDIARIVGDRDDQLIVHDHDGIRLLILNNPRKRNALTEDIRRALPEQLALASDADDVRVIILTGSGGAFSAGFDLSEITRPGGPAVIRPDPGDAARRVRKPLIAAVDGPCMTGGLELALSASFIIASDRAVFADTHARVGIFPAWGMSALLPRAIGTRRARQLSLTGQKIDAATAHEWGLVNEVTAPSHVLARSVAIAREIIMGDERSQTAQLALLAATDAVPTSAALEAEAEALGSWQTATARGASAS